MIAKATPSLRVLVPGAPLHKRRIVVDEQHAAWTERPQQSDKKILMMLAGEQMQKPRTQHDIAALITNGKIRRRPLYKRDGAP
jgi:hypothetical protein